MALKTVRLELARCPEFPDGSGAHGYEFVAPLTADGHVDVAAWRQHRGDCRVRRFWGDQPDQHGHLIHTRQRTWVFHYDLDREPAEDEPGYRFDAHVFKPDEYVPITEHDRVTRPFKVVGVG